MVGCILTGQYLALKYIYFRNKQERVKNKEWKGLREVYLIVGIISMTWLGILTVFYLFSFDIGGEGGASLGIIGMLLIAIAVIYRRWLINKLSYVKFKKNK